MHGPLNVKGKGGLENIVGTLIKVHQQNPERRFTNEDISGLYSFRI